MSKRRLLDSLLREEFSAFLQKAVNTILPGTQFLPNWHIDAIVHELDQVTAGIESRLIINQPPRSMKSITVSIAYVAWLLGRDPTLRIIVVSYNGQFAAELHRQFRMVVESNWYRRLFPGTRWDKQTDNEFVTTLGGGRLATSIGGQLTGRGGDLIIIDDPMNAGDIYSEPGRQRVIDFFHNSLVSRLNDKKSQAIIVVMQRLHEDDLSGHLLNQGGWRHLNLPAVAADDIDIPIGFDRVYHRRRGEVLHPDREDLAALARLKRDLGGLIYSAQYQQSPMPAEGNLVKLAWFRRYAVPPERKGLWQVVQSWDIATSIGDANDYSVCTTWLANGSDAYLLDCWRGRLTFPQLRRQIAELALHHKATVVVIEDAGAGLQMLQDLRADTPSGMVRPIGFKPEGSKQDRMAMQASKIESGMVHFPEEASWLIDYMIELLGFPNTRHDDQTDSTSQFLAWWTTWRARAPVIARPIVLQLATFDPFDGGQGGRF